MKKKELVKQIVRDFHLRELPECVPRDYVLPLTTRKIVTLTGVRRCGKTYLMYDMMQKLLNLKVKKKQLLYLNFEDERLAFTIDELEIILQAYRELYPEQKLSDCYFFFDEIQNIKGWDKFVRRVYDSITHRIFITGSNANLLSKEIATSLRGRTVVYEIFPLSFREYLRFMGISGDTHSSQNKAKVINHFRSFMHYGGFPEIIKENDSSVRNKILQEYFHVMLYRDMVERYQFSSTPMVKYFLHRIVDQVTKPLSVNKIFNELKSQGHRLSKNMLYDYLEAAQSVYFSLRIHKYNRSLIGRESSEKKVYIVDNGLLNALTFNFSDDYGKLLENMLFLHLRRHTEEIYFYKDIKECDFILCHRDKPQEVIQVCYDFSSPETQKREVAGIKAACDLMKKKQATIITFDQEDEIRVGQIQIKIVPAYNYFLRDNK